MFAFLPQTKLILGLEFHCRGSATPDRCGLSTVDYGLIINLNSPPIDGLYSESILLTLYHRHL
jgi:hypothetical protein